MILPNKFTNFTESILSRFPLLLKSIVDQIHINDLYINTQDDFEDVNEFIFTLDGLYALKKINFDSETGIIRKC